MKKIFASLTIFAAMLAGCQKPELDVPAGAEETFTATVEAFGALTKTSLTSNNQIAWSDGDRLAVFQASTLADEYKLIDGCDGLTNGSFRIVANNVTLNGDFSAGTEIPCNVALYPYYEDLTLSVAKTEDKKLYDISNVVLPQTQLYTENSFANGAFMMAAVTETFKDHNLKFKNVMGAVKLQFKGAKTVKTVKIKGNNNELLSGAAVVTVREDNLNPTVKMLQNASTEVVLDCGEGVVLNETEATEFIIALPPVKFEAGFTVTVTDSNGGVNTVTSNRTDNAVVRSGILVMPAMTLGEGTVVPEPEPDPEVENWSLITSMDEWTADIPLEYDGTFYFAKGVELEGENLEAKFRKDADWVVNFGLVSYDFFAGFAPSIDVTLPLSQNAVNIPLPAGKYDVYLDVVNARAWFITDGSDPTPVSYEWGIVGEVNAWGDLREDIPMLATDVEGLFVARAVDMPYGGFKIRANNAWEDHANYGFEVNSTVTADYFYHLLAGGNTRDIYVAAGTYDIWFDVLNTKVYVMTPGKDISDAVYSEPGELEPSPEPDPDVPVLTGWGISGTNTNNFADGADIMMENDGTWYVAKGVEFVQDDRFKIRKNGSWEESFGFVEYGAEFKVNEEVTLTSENGYDMFPVAGIYDIYFNPETGKTWFINDGSYPTGGTPIPDIPAVEGWGLVGEYNNWGGSPDVMLVSDGTYLVAKGVELSGQVKFRKDADWATNFGAPGESEPVEITVNTKLELVAGGKNFTVAADTYDVYLDETNATAWFINDGSYPTTPETEASTPGLDSEWALAGTFNDWADLVFKTTAVKGVFVAEKVALRAYDEIKVKKAADNWDKSFGGGIKNLEQNKWMTVYDNGSNIPVVTQGSYDIYFDSNNNKLYLMVAGTSYATAVEQTADGPAQAVDSWYIVGSFNGWNPGDADYKMAVEGDCYVFDNFTTESGCEMKFAPGKWSGDKGGNNDFAADTWLNPGGDNILVEAGTYKIYLKNDLSQYKFEKK